MLKRHDCIQDLPYRNHCLRVLIFPVGNGFNDGGVYGHT